MIENHDRIHNDLEDMYGEGGKLGMAVIELAIKAIEEARRKRDLNTLEVSQDQKPSALGDLTVESSTPVVQPGLGDLTIEQTQPDRRKTKGQETPTDPAERKVLFGQGKDGFVNNLSPEQESAVGKMLMGKPGQEIPGAENLVIRYKGEIIASTDENGVLQANEIYGKIPTETLQKLNEAIQKTAYADAPSRGGEAPIPVEKARSVNPEKVVDEPTPRVTPAPKQPEAPSIADPIQPMATVPDELRLSRPVLKNSVPTGDPVTQVQAALATVAVTGNGIATLKDEIQASAPEPVAHSTDPRAIDPQTLTGVAEGSKNKAAGIINWMRENGVEEYESGYLEVKSPNGYLGKIETNETGGEDYTFSNPQGKVVFNATLDNVGISETSEIISAVKVDTYDSKGIGNEWKAIKASMPQPTPEPKIEIPTPQQPIAETSGQTVSQEQLIALKDFAEAKVVRAGTDKRYGSMQSDPNMVMGYENLDNDKTRYQLIDKQNPTNAIAFTYDKKDGSIGEVQQSTTPPMLDMVERINSRMRQENSILKDDVAKVNVAEDREPGNAAPIPIVAEGKEIPLSTIPPQTTQPVAETAKLSQQQIATVSKSIVIINAACEADKSQETELENTKVSIEERDKNTKVYTVKDLSSGEESQFSHNKQTGDVEIMKESKVVDRLMDKEENIFAPVIPGYTDVVKTTSKSIDKEPELATGTKVATQQPSRSTANTPSKKTGR